MPRSALDIDTGRSLVLLLAAVIGLITVILNMAHSRAKEVDTPEAKRDVYRNLLSWISTIVVLLGLPAGLIFGAMYTFWFWLVSYCFESYLFLTSDKPERLRIETFKLIFGAQALVFMGLMAYVSWILSLLDALLRALQGK